MKRALVIGGTGVQGGRWVKNLKDLGYETYAYGRDYKERIKEGRYDLIVVSVPHYAFAEVIKYIDGNLYFDEIIIEKPGARDYKEFQEILKRVPDAKMFLPLYIQYGYLEPKKITYLLKLDEKEIATIDYKNEIIILKSGRKIDSNFLRDLGFHPLSLYKNPEFELVAVRYNGIYGDITLIDEKGRRAEFGRTYSILERKIDGKEVSFSNPMREMLENNYEELRLKNLPSRIWKNLDEISNLAESLLIRKEEKMYGIERNY